MTMFKNKGAQKERETCCRKRNGRRREEKKLPFVFAECCVMLCCIDKLKKREKSHANRPSAEEELELDVEAGAEEEA